MVLPGAAGTAQEIFQALTPLYYASDDSPLPPLVLVDREHWERTVPVWSAIQGLAGDRRMSSAVHLVDTPQDAVRLLT